MELKQADRPAGSHTRSDNHHPRIAHLICPQVIGGAETVVRLLAAARTAMNRATTVVTMTDLGDHHPLVRGLRLAGVHVVVLPLLGRRYGKAADLVAGSLADHRIDLLHTHVYRADFIGYFAARRLGIPAVSTFHGDTGGDFKNRVYEWAVKRLYRRFDAVIAVSAVNRDKLRNVLHDLSRVSVVPNGIALEAVLDQVAARAQLGIDAGQRVVGWIGRLSPEKGPDLLLDAVASMPEPRPLIVVVGDGPLRMQLELRARDLSIPVLFAGAMPDASRLLRAFDTVVMSSRTEGTPMVLLEAMGAGVPVVAFGVGGIPTLLTDSRGWLVSAGDVPALGMAIATAVTNTAESRRRSVAAQTFIRRNYSVNSWVNAVDDVYAAALEKKLNGIPRRSGARHRN
jgi:glycosyltransferase involved in cell wall biosynthesis